MPNDSNSKSEQQQPELSLKDYLLEALEGYVSQFGEPTSVILLMDRTMVIDLEHAEGRLGAAIWPPLLPDETTMSMLATALTVMRGT